MKAHWLGYIGVSKKNPPSYTILVSKGLVLSNPGRGSSRGMRKYVCTVPFTTCTVARFVSLYSVQYHCRRELSPVTKTTLIPIKTHALKQQKQLHPTPMMQLDWRFMCQLISKMCLLLQFVSMTMLFPSIVRLNSQVGLSWHWTSTVVSNGMRSLIPYPTMHQCCKTKTGRISQKP